ncbi:Hypothetical predicted protein [Mytilus galloprovincialis]|uniref:Uncharacterized protein n=1 Tax=Mytilus galloprovincialis TaxID=29158 RepID=A0A8B6BET7_MYTGA|nr:Hypothetical predicted protein [Mytilus galloprovincialis]
MTEIRVDIREWESDHKATTRGVSLSAMRWKGLHDFAEDIDQTMEKMSEKEEVDVKIHLGGNIYTLS